MFSFCGILNVIREEGVCRHRSTSTYPNSMLSVNLKSMEVFDELQNVFLLVLINIKIRREVMIVY